MNIIWQEDFSGGIEGLNNRWYNRAYKDNIQEEVKINGETKVIQPFTSPLIENPAENELWQVGDLNNVPHFVQAINTTNNNNAFSIIKSNTPQNGYLFFDSDLLGREYTSLVELETKDAIDLTGKSVVYFRLFFHLRRYFEILYPMIKITL